LESIVREFEPACAQRRKPTSSPAAMVAKAMPSAQS
jgi:hypothetical protein